MYFPNVFIAWDSEITSFDQSPIDVLPLNFSHLLFVEDPQVLTYEFWVDGNDFDDFMPKLEKLAPDLVKVLHQLERYLIGVIQVDPLREGDD